MNSESMCVCGHSKDTHWLTGIRLSCRHGNDARNCPCDSFVGVINEAEITVFIGVIGSGKDHRAHQLVARGHRRIDFKDELLTMCSDIAGYDVRADYDWFKENPVGVMRPSDPVEEAKVRNEVAEMLRRWPDLMTGRRLLTRLGTEGMRKRDNDYWVKQFARAAAPVLASGQSVVVADCRFGNEITAIRGLPYRSRFIFCDYHSGRYDPALPHASEWLAQAMLKIGPLDGDEISPNDLFQAMEMMRARSKKKQLSA